MALATTIVGDGILISLTTSKRQWGIWSGGVKQGYTETQIEEVREWVALTQAIAQSTATTATQPGTGVSTYVASEDNRNIKSYKLTVTTTTTTVTQD